MRSVEVAPIVDTSSLGPDLPLEDFGLKLPEVAIHLQVVDDFSWVWQPRFWRVRLRDKRGLYRVVRFQGHIISWDSKEAADGIVIGEMVVKPISTPLKGTGRKPKGLRRYIRRMKRRK